MHRCQYNICNGISVKPDVVWVAGSSSLFRSAHLKSVETTECIFYDGTPQRSPPKGQKRSVRGQMESRSHGFSTKVLRFLAVALTDSASSSLAKRIRKYEATPWTVCQVRYSQTSLCPLIGTTCWTLSVDRSHCGYPVVRPAMVLLSWSSIVSFAGKVRVENPSSLNCIRG